MGKRNGGFRSDRWLVEPKAAMIETVGQLSDVPRWTRLPGFAVVLASRR
jgi:hypothetical protein